MTKLVLTENAKTVLKSRYLLRDEQGAVTETPEQLFERVAKAVAAVEKSDKRQWQKKFLEMMLSRRFMPNSPTLMNAGKKEGQLSACFVLPIEDSLRDIFETLKDAAIIQQSGGGTGFAFSDLRPKGSRVASTSGSAAGPVASCMCLIPRLKRSGRVGLDEARTWRFFAWTIPIFVSLSKVSRTLIRLRTSIFPLALPMSSCAPRL